MATSTVENYTKLKEFIRLFPNDVKKKKDLLRIKNKRILLKYFSYKKYFHIDNRLNPKNTIKELKKFKRRNIFFKSEELGISLLNNYAFNDSDYYDTSTKFIAKVTNAMLGHETNLVRINYERKTFYIGYQNQVTARVVAFDLIDNHNLDFLIDLPMNYYININGTSYNKNGADFLFDYHNPSNDYKEQLMSKVKDINLFIYKRF
jgi:hypothetical protein